LNRGAEENRGVEEQMSSGEEGVAGGVAEPAEGQGETRRQTWSWTRTRHYLVLAVVFPVVLASVLLSLHTAT
jgi:hypothetical protein